ncbi:MULTISPECIES: response regulator transcription factor [Nocardioides]|uniref:response regulator transcription factor n=1 Tax=Nocardioides TaxID=1839 RepID=UPI0018DF0021|nr:MULTISPECIES: helix-turn-helix transcriptional regulator [unclassified Nocardioides]
MNSPAGSPGFGEVQPPGVTVADTDLVLLSCLADGATLHEVARRLHISHRTASRRLSEICASLGVSRPIQAVAWAARRGLI